MNAPFSHDRLAIAADASACAPRNVLLLAHARQAPYRVMRCVAALGAKVYVFASPEARSLGISRYCVSLREFAFDPPPLRNRAVAEIEEFAAAHGIDMILPADAVATRFLATIKPLLSVPTFPIPDLKTFDQLATKDRFMEFCRERGVRHPEGRLLANREALVAALQNGAVRLPAILKPINRWGSVGVVRIDADNALEIASQIDYAPVLVQDFIKGLDRSISIFGSRGKIAKQVTYSYPNNEFTFVREPELERIVGDIARDLKLDGVYNFDARIEEDGTVWLIECNPRFFFTMDAAMVAGANFAQIEHPGLQDRILRLRENSEIPAITVPDGQLRQPEALLRNLLRGRLPNALDLKMLCHWLADPLYFGLAVAGFKRRWHSRVRERRLIAGIRA